MTGLSILSQFCRFTQLGKPLFQLVRCRQPGDSRPTLHDWWQHPDALPAFVQADPIAMRYVRLLGPLAWHQFPERDLQRHFDRAPMPYAPFVAACLVKLDQQLPHMSNLRQFLVDHPALVWLLGFPPTSSLGSSSSLDTGASLPTHRHFTRMLRQLPNAALQVLLDSSIVSLQAELADRGHILGTCVTLDTKHILAWVRENNPKAYISDRFDKDKRPAGDPDCRLGCKRRHNQRASFQSPPSTPSHNPVPANTLSVGEFYWGYASGIVAAKVPGWGEFVLAELTQPFDQADVSYFFPLMHAAEKRLGFRPKYAAFDAAFDAFYVYEYFHNVGGFAAVPFSERGGHSARQFSPGGLPLCAAGLPMPVRYRFVDRSTLVEHERARHVCPLRFPYLTASVCPVNDRHWDKGGCTTTLPTSIGARLRYTLDRQAAAYQDVYKQRTATERINSQAVELGIERPKIRNGQAIANLNTLIYILINLRALQRLQQRKPEQPAPVESASPAA